MAALGLAGLLGGAAAAGEAAPSPVVLSAPVPSGRPDAATARVLATRGWVMAPGPATASSDGSSVNRLTIPSLQVDAPVDLAHAVAGALELPSDASRVARYDASPAFAAAAGTTIVAGHVTSTPQIGALFPLATVHRGAVVRTTDGEGRQQTWRVVSVSAPLKADLPASLFTASGPRRLAIITCGGEPTLGPDGRRHYPRNVVVIATPAEPAAPVG